MTNFYKTTFVILFVACIALSGRGQSGGITVRFIANCSLEITDGISTIYFDFPYKSGAHHYMTYDSSELRNISDSAVFIFTHKHSDHYSGKLVRQLKGRVYGPWNLKKLAQLDSTLEDFSIQCIKTKHSFSFKHYSYVITWHDKKILVAGDAQNAEALAGINDIDQAFLPVWLITDANNSHVKIDAKHFNVYHIGPLDHITTEDPLITLLDRPGAVVEVQ
jgi:L-ascorbate metabolism protein UlaG (beta-lactamase superfamily)